jgi:CRISPR/Cas system-associated exonuclease Cas4 (RecB family)
MIITYFRSSSYNQYSMCPHAYYLTYVLGHQSPSGQAAEKGTIVHKVMECLAQAKLAHQEGKDHYMDEHFGKMDASDHDHVYSDKFVDELVDKSFEYYTVNSKHHYAPRHYKHCKEWSYQAITHCDGAFDPRKRDIVAPEGSFDFEIEEPWAEYSYDLPDGTKLEGRLSMKGTIDLITQVRTGVYEVIDWKTGRRLDWATGQEKTFKKLTTDPQLRIYHYALSKMYPDIDQFIMTIYFIKDGGPYTLAFTRDDIEETKEMLRKRFESIRDSKVPQLKKSWKCTKICHFGKTDHPSGIINPETGSPFTICEFVAKKIRSKGIDVSITEDISPGHKFDYYQAPGGQ